MASESFNETDTSRGLFPNVYLHRSQFGAAWDYLNLHAQFLSSDAFNPSRRHSGLSCVHTRRALLGTTLKVSGKDSTQSACSACSSLTHPHDCASNGYSPGTAAARMHQDCSQ
eukprot:5172997-Amphidinium_carterae.1